MIELGELGARIQALRRGRGLTLQELAEVAAVSASMLSSVERGRKAPTIVVLARIADGLGVPLTELIVGGGNPVIVRRAGQQDVIDEAAGWRREILTPVIPGVNFEWIRTTLPPGVDPGPFPGYAPGSHEFVLVESGTLQLTIGPGDFTLHAGDSVYFRADTMHRYASLGGVPCVYYVAALIMRPRGTVPARTLAERPRRPPSGAGAQRPEDGVPDLGVGRGGDTLLGSELAQ